MTTSAHLTRYIGRCPACKVILVLESPLGGWRMNTTCPCGHRFVIKAIDSRVTSTKCGVRCTSAIGPSCDCECGGKNHGSDHH